MARVDRVAISKVERHEDGDSGRPVCLDMVPEEWRRVENVPRMELDGVCTIALVDAWVRRSLRRPSCAPLALTPRFEVHLQDRRVGEGMGLG